MNDSLRVPRSAGKICFRDGLKVSKVLSGNFFTQLSQLFPDRIFCDQFPRIVLDYFPCSRELFIYFLACIYLKLKFSSQDKCRVFFSIYFGLGSIPSRRLAVSEHHFSYCVFFPLPFLLDFILMYAAWSGRNGNGNSSQRVVQHLKWKKDQTEKRNKN